MTGLLSAGSDRQGADVPIGASLKDKERLECMNRRIEAVLLAAVLCIGLLTGCGGGDTELAVYQLGEDQVVSLESIMDEGEALLTSIDEPTDAALDAELATYTYHYRQIEDPALLAAAYIEVLADAEQGFTIIDSECHRLEEKPNLETLTGEIYLAKTSSTEGKLFQVIVAWSEFAIAIQISQPSGKILPPPEPEVEAPSVEESRPTAMSEQLDFFNGLNPGAIGLEGDDMGDYTVYPKQGWVLVDSFSCRELDVYLEDARDGTNVYMGTYYLSSDLQHLYQKTAGGDIVQVALS